MMRYTAAQYATALCSLLKGKSPREQKLVLARFPVLLRAHGAWGRREKILVAVGVQELKETGRQKIEISSAAPISAAAKREIVQALGSKKKALVQEKIKPDLLAGVQILINDEVLIDASAAHMLSELFGKDAKRVA